MLSFKKFLLNEEVPMGDPSSTPLGADPMGPGSPMGGMGGAPPMGGGMGPMGGGMGGMGDPMGGMGGMGAPDGGQNTQIPIDIKDADVWKVLDHIINKKPLPKKQEKPPMPGQQNPQQNPMGGMPDPMGGGMGGGMGGDMMGGGMPPTGGMNTPPSGAPSPMGM